jgi:hypothetical protein
MDASQAHLGSRTNRVVVAVRQRWVATIAINRIQFQPGLSMPEFLKVCGTEARCELALEAVRWPKGFRCPQRDSAAHCVVRDGSRNSFSVKPSGIKPS